MIPLVSDMVLIRVQQVAAVIAIGLASSVEQLPRVVTEIFVRHEHHKPDARIRKAIA